MNAPIIYRLSIERFRCIKTFTWHPAKGVNVILGGGDVGKTTILDAIALLLSPANPATLSDTEYHARAGRCRICYRSDCLLAGGEWS